MKTNHVKQLILGLLIPLVFANCTPDTTQQIAHLTDYQQYLKVTATERVAAIQKEIDFWQNKFDGAPNQSSYLITLAAYYSELFEVTGVITHLYKAEQLLIEANEKFGEQEASIHRAIARNYITQHRFKEALTYLEKAEKLGANKIGTQKMLFDVHMELGNYRLAKEQLTAIQSPNDFDYLIRVAKWNDHNGQLETAITSMEKAMKIAENENNQALKLWVYSNIGDFYGHAGRIEDSYAYYLKTLKEDPSNTYALKGIAWIAFSHDRNAEQALEIIRSIETKRVSPELYLIKATIAEFQANELEQAKALYNYNEQLAVHKYGVMYHTYTIELMAENPKYVEDALKLAQIEIQNRPTPASYDLLAWCFFKKGDKEKAFEVVQTHTLGKSFEPTILYHTAEILKANNQTAAVAPLKKELLASLYELGPHYESKIRNL
jgi:tetratricopeptide (TPR) repeat protein